LKIEDTLQEILHIAREQCQEQELLANLPGAMPGKTPGKVTRGNPSQKLWQNVCSRKDSCVVRKSRTVQHFARGCATKNPWQIAKPANLSAKPPKAT